MPPIRVESPLELAIDANNDMGESPIWSSAEQALIWIEVNVAPKILRWDAASSRIDAWPMPERIGGLVLKESGGALVTLASGLYDFDFATGALNQRVRSPLPPHIAMHECLCDRDGRFWVGAINTRAREYPSPPLGAKLYRLDDDRLIEQVDGITCVNGLAVSPDGQRLYMTDSRTRQVECWTIDRATGNLSDHRLFVEIEEGAGFVDGATVDSEGNYWAAMVFGGALRCYRPDGSLALDYKLPFDNPTKMAFGGPDLRTLYITTTRLKPREGAPGPGAEMQGAVYSVRVSVPGVEDRSLPPPVRP